jgi:methylphosphotriester-DNA--protein-cysteine methyltransferase
MPSKKSIDYAPQHLKIRIHAIWTVNDWAKEMGWDRSLFSRKFRRHFRIPAKEWLHQEKMQTIHTYLLSSPEAKHFEIAYDLGFKDEKALYDYVRYHYSCSTGFYIRELQERNSNRFKRLLAVRNERFVRNRGVNKSVQVE